MSFSLVKDIRESDFLLVVMDEKEYLRRLEEIIKTVDKTKTKICYICLNTPYTSIVNQFNLIGINTKNFFFIDGVSRSGKTSGEKCRFLSSPPSAGELESAIKDAIERKKCTAVVFDTISSLLVYQDSFSILHMTNNLQKKTREVKKIFLVVRETRSDMKFIKDLGMFADRIASVGKP